MHLYSIPHPEIPAQKWSVMCLLDEDDFLDDMARIGFIIMLHVLPKFLTFFQSRCSQNLGVTYLLILWAAGCPSNNVVTHSDL